MRIHVEITLRLNGQIAQRMFRQQRQHVIEERNTCRNARLATAVNRQGQRYLRLGGIALYFSASLFHRVLSLPPRICPFLRPFRSSPARNLGSDLRPTSARGYFANAGRQTTVSPSSMLADEQIRNSSEKGKQRIRVWPAPRSFVPAWRKSSSRSAGKHPIHLAWPPHRVG